MTCTSLFVVKRYYRNGLRTYGSKMTSDRIQHIAIKCLDVKFSQSIKIFQKRVEYKINFSQISWIEDSTSLLNKTNDIKLHE